MQIRTVLNSFKESLKNIIRHPLVTLASISTVALMLMLLGAFTVISLNAQHMIKEISQQPTVSVWVDAKATAEQLSLIEQAISSRSDVTEWSKLTPMENYENLVKDLGEESNVLSGYDPTQLPYVYNVRLESPELASTFKKQIVAYSGVQPSDVTYDEKVMQTLTDMMKWVNYATLLAFAIMCAITLFIISNMVRISVLSRSEEINIMKYIGATNAYIRFPYILEGAIIGAFGAVIAWIAVRTGYETIFTNLLKTAGGGNSALSAQNLLLPISNVSWKVLLISLVLGILVGAAGSAISVRRHIRV